MRDDLRGAVRSLLGSPTVTTVALIVLALGIGAASALFSVVDAVVLRGLPFDEHDRLHAVLEFDTLRPTTFGGGTTTSQMYLDWRERQRSFEGLTAVANMTFRIRNETGEPADARAQRVSWEFFDTFRVSPILGRKLRAEDEVEGEHRKAILSYGFWQRHYGGAPDAVGRLIDLSDERWEIVGVMPPGFDYPVGNLRATEIYVPLMFRPADRRRENSRNYNYTIIGRLRPGITRVQAQDEMFRITEALDQEYPKWTPGRRARVLTLHDHLVGRARPWMMMLLGAVGLLLVIACANVANLMLARSTARAREVGIRAALGASRWRIARSLLVEGVVLALCGAALGVALAYGGVQVLRAWLPANLPRVADIAVDLRVLLTTIGAAVATGMLFGVAPALHASRADVVTVLKDGGRSATVGYGHRLRNLLVVAEVALAVVLLVGAGLFAGSFINVVRIDPGFDHRNVLTYSISTRVPGMPPSAEAAARGRAVVDRTIEAIAALPGVQMVGGVQQGLPLSGNWSRSNISLPGRGRLTGDDDAIDIQTVTANYLELMRIPLLRGRGFTADDREGSPPVVIINDAAARKYWPGEDPIGKRVEFNSKDRLVVGIARDIRQLGLETPPRHMAYLPERQETTYGTNLVIRTSVDPMTLIPAVKAAIWAINPEQRLTQEIVTLEGYFDRLIAQRRFNMALLVLFGALGLVITAAGIFGVMAYVVEQRTGEIGLRMALGATPRGVLAMVVGRAALLMAIGLVVGAAAAWQLSASVRSLLFQIEPGDPRIFAVVVVILSAAGFAASAFPARRAARVDPMIALRTE